MAWVGDLRKTIKAKVSSRTNNSKLDILGRTFDRWKDILKERFDEEIETYDELRRDDIYSDYIAYAVFKAQSKEEALPLRNDIFNLERRSNEVSEYWISVPTAERRGGVWLPIDMAEKYHGFEEEWDIRDSEVTKEEDGFYIHIKVEKEIDVKEKYSGVLGVDLGVRHVAVTWNTAREKPSFYGKELRKVRGKYHYLRQKLQSEGKEEAIKTIKDREYRKSDHIIHNISREIVDQAKEDNLAIVIGEFSDYRGSNFGKKANRHLHHMPVGELKRQIKYKAKEAGIKCEIVDESYTTVTCSECGHQRESRPGKQFDCPKCGYEVNSDINGAKNISSRGSSYMLESGASIVGLNPDTEISL